MAILFLLLFKERHLTVVSSKRKCEILYSNFFFAAIYCHILVIMDILVVIDFCGLQNWTMQNNLQYAYMDISTHYENTPMQYTAILHG